MSDDSTTSNVPAPEDGFDLPFGLGDDDGDKLYPGTIFGIRQFVITPNGELAGPIAVEPFPPREWMHATCRDYARSGHREAPTSGCGCGLYAFNGGTAAIQTYPSTSDRPTVLAVVEARGKVVAHRLGFRAEYMRPVALICDPGGPWDGRDEETTRARVHDAIAGTNAYSNEALTRLVAAKYGIAALATLTGIDEWPIEKLNAAECATDDELAAAGVTRRSRQPTVTPTRWLLRHKVLTGAAAIALVVGGLAALDAKRGRDDDGALSRYLGTDGISETSLVNRLVTDGGLSAQRAEAAVYRRQVDWDAQALAAAASHLNGTEHSPGVAELESTLTPVIDDFTASGLDAALGVDATQGADGEWNISIDWRPFWSGAELEPHLVNVDGFNWSQASQAVAAIDPSQWEAEALTAASDYIDLLDASRQGALEFMVDRHGFDAAVASAALDSLNGGAGWNDHAYRTANDMLDYGTTIPELRDRLVAAKFTAEQVDFAIGLVAGTPDAAARYELGLGEGISRTGLINRVSGLPAFRRADQDWAEVVDGLKVDWDAQARQAATSTWDVLSSLPDFTVQDLRESLTNAGFKPSQVEQAVASLALR